MEFVQLLLILLPVNGLLVKNLQPGMTHILFNNLTVPYEPQGSRIKEFYRHGQNFSNTVSLETGGDKGGIHLSLNNTDNLGIVPNNKFNRKINESWI